MLEYNLLISNFDRKIEHGLRFVSGVRIVERWNYSPIEGGYDETVIIEGDRERLREGVARGLDYARDYGLTVQCNNLLVRQDLKSGILDTTGLLVVDCFQRTIVDGRDRPGDRTMTKNDPERVRQITETLLPDLFKFADCSEWDCYRCPLRLKEPEEDLRYGSYHCGWILLVLAASKILRK